MWEVNGTEVQRVAHPLSETDCRKDFRKEKYYKSLKDYMLTVNKFSI